MRRKDRQVLDKDTIVKIIDKCNVCRLGFIDNDEVYIVPLNFGYTFEDKLILYFHGALKGRKADILSHCPIKTGVEMDCNHKLLVEEKACNCSFNYSSIIGTGEAVVINELEEKKFALNQIMLKYIDKTFDFNEKALSNTMIFKVTLDNYSAKQLLRDTPQS